MQKAIGYANRHAMEPLARRARPPRYPGSRVKASAGRFPKADHESLSIQILPHFAFGVAIVLIVLKFFDVNPAGLFGLISTANKTSFPLSPF